MEEEEESEETQKPKKTSAANARDKNASNLEELPSFLKVNDIMSQEQLLYLFGKNTVLKEKINQVWHIFLVFSYYHHCFWFLDHETK